MSADQRFEKVRAIFVEDFELEADEVRVDSNLYEDLDLDSLDSVDLIVALENSFGFKVDRVKDAEALKGLKTVGDILAYIEAKEAE